MNRETNFMNFENLNRLIEEHKKETYPYKKYEFDSTSYTLLLIDINNLVKENKILKENAENNDKVVDKVNWENQLLKKENKQLKEQLLVTQTNEETFRLEMKDITQTLGLDEDTIFDDVKIYARSLKDNWNKLKEFIAKEYYMYLPLEASTKSITILIDKMHELEGSDSNEI